MAVIYITEADETQHKFRLPEEEGAVVTIGRNEDCVIPMPGITGLSGLHCSITLSGGVYVITDEGSSNGTFCGERAISSEVLGEGVAYAIGNALLYFDAESAAAPAEAPAPVVEEPAAATPVRRKKKVSAVKMANKAMAAQRKKAETMSAINYVYVLLVLAFAFYGGLTLRHWMETGDFLAPFAQKAAKK